MNRIVIKRRKNKKNSFWIKDILDGKKLGKITIKNNTKEIKYKAKLKIKFNQYNLKQEVLMTISQSWEFFYYNFIKDYNKSFIDIEHYEFPLFVESCRLKSCENDMFDRPALLHPAARKAWNRMKKSALEDRIDLQIISAYRSLDYQKQLINNKLDKRVDIKDILNVNTLPGFSEHHTGCAIDIGSVDEPVLEEAFDQSNAFKWLTENAKNFGFKMTYPKGNTTGICYEPWHWCYKPSLNLPQKYYSDMK